MTRFFLLTICFAFILACNQKESASSNLIAKSDNKNSEPQIKKRKFYSLVDGLRIRKSPNLSDVQISNLNEGEEVLFLNKISKDSVEAKLRGKIIKAPFYMIKTKKGIVGWVFSGALSDKLLDVVEYSVAIAFESEYSAKPINNFSFFINNAQQIISGSNIQLIYADADYENVKIYNNNGQVVGTENISNYVKKYGTGVVCVKKDKDAGFNLKTYVFPSKSMGESILEVFSKTKKQNN